MALYRLWSHEGERRTIFHETDLPTIDALRSEVARCAGDFIASGATSLWSDGGWTMDVTDADGAVVFSLSLTVANAPAFIEPAPR